MNKTEIRKIANKEIKKAFNWAIEMKEYKKVYTISRINQTESHVHIDINVYTENIYINEFKRNDLLKNTLYLTRYPDYTRLTVVIKKEDFSNLLLKCGA